MRYLPFILNLSPLLILYFCSLLFHPYFISLRSIRPFPFLSVLSHFIHISRHFLYFHLHHTFFHSSILSLSFIFTLSFILLYSLSSPIFTLSSSIFTVSFINVWSLLHSSILSPRPSLLSPSFIFTLSFIHLYSLFIHLYSLLIHLYSLLHSSLLSPSFIFTYSFIHLYSLLPTSLLSPQPSFLSPHP